MNYLMPTKATLEYSHESLRLKISKKMIGRICAEELKITIEENDFITLSLVFDSTDNVSTDSMPEVPDEGGITSKSSNFLVNPTVKITFIDILIVDDIEFNISVLENLLGNLKHKCTCENTHRKFKVHSANSGKQAIDMVRKLNAQKGGYKLIIMDCLMPEMSGWEATIEIIKMFKENQIKVLPHILAYSAFDSRLDISTSLNSGMCGHISKPCMPKDLCKSINFWLNTPLSINFSHN